MRLIIALSCLAALLAASGCGPRADGLRSRIDRGQARLDPAKRLEGESMTNAKLAGMAIMEYSEAHHDRLPDARRWEDEVEAPFQKDEKLDVSMPSRPGDRLAMNVRLSGVKVDSLADPDHTVLLYETQSGAKNACGLPPRQHYVPYISAAPNRQVIVFADGWICDCPAGLPPGPPGATELG